MKEIMEVDLKGNEGSTIESIVSFSKHRISISNVEELEKYEIELKLKNGATTKLEFDYKYLLHEEESFGSSIKMWRRYK